MPSDARPSCRAGSFPAASAQHHHQHPPANAEALPCPRCDSINTKFCYYNNYNLSQPRHFCKSCRRYWTQGGTLRNVPVGGGSRKPPSSKRFRSIPATSSAPSTSSPASTSSSLTSEPLHPPTFASPKNPGEVPGAFTSLLTSQVGGGHGFLALGGFGSGYAPTLVDGLGFNRTAVWPFAEVGYIEGVYPPPSNLSAPAAAPPPYNAWQLGGGESGGGNTGAAQVDGTADGFAWPELAISMPGQGLK